MDVLFHGVSAGVLAGCLGEKRPKQLVYAAVIGISPDALWFIANMFPDYRYLYSLNHSLLINLPICLLVCCFNWRIAFGGLLHVFFDVFTHKSSTMHLFFPFSQVQLPIGISWWSWPGLLLWASLWGGLVCFCAGYYMRHRHNLFQKRIEM